MGVLTSVHRRAALVAMTCVLAGTTVRSQDVPLEYQVKAVYLFNFIKFTEWPPSAPAGPISVCVAGSNPFGDALIEAVEGEAVNGRSLEVRLLRKPERDCHLLFVPDGTAEAPFLKAVQDAPTLTVGEAENFLEQGGMVRFFLEEGRVRFQIDPAAAKRADVRISSHVLNLSRGRRQG